MKRKKIDHISLIISSNKLWMFSWKSPNTEDFVCGCNRYRLSIACCGKLVYCWTNLANRKHLKPKR